ncbi:MAG: hypothetical protein ACON4E_00530 [Flavobacteriales bacterium]
MTSKKALKIIAIGLLIQSASVVLAPTFYSDEIMKGLDNCNIHYIKLLIILCAAIGMGFSLLVLFISTVEEKIAKSMLIGVSTSMAVITAFIVGYFFFTPLSIPIFIVFSSLILTFFGFSIALKK